MLILLVQQKQHCQILESIGLSNQNAVHYLIHLQSIGFVMRGKKKAPIEKEKAPQNKPKTIITNDSKQFKIIDSLLLKYSNFLKNILQEEKDDAIKLPGIDGEAMEYIQQFMIMHKEKQPIKLSFPIKSNQDLKLIMEEADAMFIQEIMGKGQKLYKKVLDGTTYLDVQEFKKRLIVGLVVKIIGKTVQQLKEEYGLRDDYSEEEIRKQIREKFEILKDAADD